MEGGLVNAGEGHASIPEREPVIRRPVDLDVFFERDEDAFDGGKLVEVAGVEQARADEEVHREDNERGAEGPHALVAAKYRNQC